MNKIKKAAFTVVALATLSFLAGCEHHRGTGGTTGTGGGGTIDTGGTMDQGRGPTGKHLDP